MNEKALAMKKEIKSISGYRALILSKVYICILLTISTLYLGIHRISNSPLYILLILLILPSIISYVLQDYTLKKQNHFIINLIQEPPVLLNSLRKKYRYSRVSYLSNQIAYLITVLLICLWQISNMKDMYLSDLLCKLPLLILTTALTLRFLLAILYSFKIPHDVMLNKI